MQFRLALLMVLIVCASPVALFAKETKDVKFPLKNGDAVVFSHDVHLLKYNNNCRICHNAIFDLKARRHFTMAEMEKTKSCGACHTGIKAFSVADEKSCVKCHKGKPRNVEFKIKGLGQTTFSHSVHLAKVSDGCKSCHNGTVITGKEGRVTMAQMEKGKTCGACHNGKKAFTVAGNCGKCHAGMKPREITWKAKGVTDAKFSHDFHLEAFTCKDCHTKLFAFKAGAKHFTMADMQKGKSCGGCHNGKEAFTVAGDCNKCHKGYKPGQVIFKNEGGEVKFSHDFHLEAYKCADCHNKIFPMQAGAKHHTMGDMEKGMSCGACHNGKDAFTSNGDCDKCHKM
ncbi:cytochrome c3 family protein [Geomonas sp. Red69]|uniref:Cytochrome c3 family protein n=1 Tax=Geomonas diazotrophica TaxID=2843197 RepID=A0ABX8JQX0_9BACT|nr:MULTISPECIES: cytochrome c3 family protein [Geomonas]MBU5637232.1 cytochrome c3 family protein [Geomonas diazotrophica]QWV99526.1 cytochrome c3 family protein [Geomonas nitrogeniifigens]QXE88701.1 cytochrome c3 family protein [Geomonas nitrogeniifigens]